MKKIMFNDKYGLTDAVLDGRKTMTRRVIADKDEIDAMVYARGSVEKKMEYLLGKSKYKIGEVVAIAQRYSELSWDKRFYDNLCSMCDRLPQYELKGWDNKMFVRAYLMPHQIKITDVKIERLQDISAEDCLKEGIYVSDTFTKYGIRNGYSPQCANDPKEKKWWFNSPREAFAALIDKVSGKGTWEINPYVFAYTFKLSI